MGTSPVHPVGKRPAWMSLPDGRCNPHRAQSSERALSRSERPDRLPDLLAPATVNRLPVDPLSSGLPIRLLRSRRSPRLATSAVRVLATFPPGLRRELVVLRERTFFGWDAAAALGCDLALSGRIHRGEAAIALAALGSVGHFFLAPLSSNRSFIRGPTRNLERNSGGRGSRKFDHRAEGNARLSPHPPARPPAVAAEWQPGGRSDPRRFQSTGRRATCDV